jgi:hypothetical protein
MVFSKLQDYLRRFIVSGYDSLFQHVYPLAFQKRSTLAQPLRHIGHLLNCFALRVMVSIVVLVFGRSSRQVSSGRLGGNTGVALLIGGKAEEGQTPLVPDDTRGGYLMRERRYARVDYRQQ